MQSLRRNKSILYISVYDPHVPLTGAGVRGAQFVNNLAKEFDVDLVYLDGSGQPPISELSRKYSSNLKDVRSTTRINFSRFSYFIFSRELFFAAYKLLQHHKYDFIVCDYGASGLYGLMFSRKYRVPLIYCSHNIEYRQHLGKEKTDKRRWLTVPYIYLIERLTVKYSNILVPISMNDALYYSQWTNQNKMVVIPQGFDESLFNPFYEPVNNNPKIILFCGNYNIHTNREAVDIVMKNILDKVIAIMPNTKFSFMGANPPRQPSHPNVEFTGFMEDYPAYLKRADVVISPIQGGWGFPTKIIEALACGKPIIATPLGARSLERDYKSLIIAEVEQFPDMICQVLKSSERSDLVDFQKLKSRYSWDVNIQVLINRMSTY